MQTPQTPLDPAVWRTLDLDHSYQAEPDSFDKKKLFFSFFPEESRARCLFMRARIAVALAVIKTKPPGASGRDHGEALARRLRRLDEGWRDKARGLQQEVLRLQQQLLITVVTSNTRSSSQVAGEASS